VQTDGLLDEGAAKVLFWPMFKAAYEDKGYKYIWLLDEGMRVIQAIPICARLVTFEKLCI
jgi:hypothetical protein